ncbi:MAG: MMPL family transporter [Dactylosporangium sp.]|nr:MMPL family transporter [Dactylosporangium sp.]NNJ59979.1 MMPL family transporter [Dactylosporangium sp.]
MVPLARWCSRWRFAVLGGWLVVLLLLAAQAVRIGSAFTDSSSIPSSESATAHSLLAQAEHSGASAPSGSTVTGNIAWHTDGVAVTDAAVRTDLLAMLGTVATLPGVKQVVSPYDAGGGRQLNTAANTAYATVLLAEDADVTPVIQAAEQVRSATVDVRVGGQAFDTMPESSTGAEVIGLLAALAVLLLVFRSVWAAALPIITGVAGVVASLLVVMLASHVLDLADTSLTMGALIGLGVGIDYALFIVNRHRKALIAGAPVPEAIAQALQTSGRAVVFAGLTVVMALLGMIVVNLDVLTGMAQVAGLTVLFTVAAAITLLPALLAALGYRVLSRRQRRTLAHAREARTAAVPHAHGRHRRSGPAPRWTRLLLQQAPRRIGAAALLVIVVLAWPVTSMRVGAADASSDPVGSTTRAYHDLMSDAFGQGFDAALLLVARTPDTASATAFGSLVDRLPSITNVAAVHAAPVPAGQPIAVATVMPAASAQTEQTADLVTTLRDRVIPAAESGTQLRVYVGGSTATNIDLSQALIGKLPLYLGLIAVLGFLLLAMAFRSVLVPLIGAVSNVATIVVGLGAITAIFQFGWGSSLLGVGSAAPIMYIVPVLVVGVMFGLSMDYQVFLVSRMHEEWTRTGDNARSVRIGVAETAQVIATAAAIMLCVFASFGFSGERIVSAIGIGLASAVLVDAIVVRLTLVPALMSLIGRHNWSYPRWADRLTPRLSIEGSAEPPQTISVPAAAAGAAVAAAPADRLVASGAAAPAMARK